MISYCMQACSVGCWMCCHIVVPPLVLRMALLHFSESPPSWRDSMSQASAAPVLCANATAPAAKAFASSTTSGSDFTRASADCSSATSISLSAVGSASTKRRCSWVTLYPLRSLGCSRMTNCLSSSRSRGAPSRIDANRARLAAKAFEFLYPDFSNCFIFITSGNSYATRWCTNSYNITPSAQTSVCGSQTFSRQNSGDIY
mmetsp:Transcript_516/g.1603  ORF Transcript_516/g.1603 Transcript_516/m.1603 type:complete len:201 (-) Transcript_516:799-1401(-)